MPGWRRCNSAKTPADRRAATAQTQAARRQQTALIKPPRPEAYRRATGQAGASKTRRRQSAKPEGTHAALTAQNGLYARPAARTGTLPPEAEQSKAAAAPP